MTQHLEDIERRVIGDRLRRLIRTKYGSQTAAGRAWRVSQSAVSLLVNGKRGTGRSEALGRIAAAERMLMSDLLAAPDQPHLRQIPRDGLESSRFVYDVHDPHRMLKQVESWFADVPGGTKMKRQLVKAVMRALLDESFDFEIHRPSDTWRPVMDSAEGWPHKGKGSGLRRRDSSGFRP